MSQLSGVIGFQVGQIKTPFVLGLDLQGGTHLEYEADLSRIAVADRRDSLGGVRDVIERRVNALGVSEPLIQTTQAGDSWRVTIELAGISDVNQAIRMIGETPILEFKEKNTEPPRELTAEEKADMARKNDAANTRAEEALFEAKKPGVDFAALAKERSEIQTYRDVGGDIGFLHGKTGYEDLVTFLQDVPVGSVAGNVLEMSHAYVVAKVEERKESGKEVDASHLLISWQGAQGGLSQLTKEQARAKIEELKQQATPENFEQLAKENSHEPGAAEGSGNLGWFGPGIMTEVFEAEAFAMATNTISNIVETPFGYHLIWKRDERPHQDIHARIIEFPRIQESDLLPPAEEWKSTELTGKELESARVAFDQTGGIQVSLQFNTEGAKLFADITKRNIGQQVAIFLDGQPISAPVVQDEIIGGQAVISGNFTVTEAKVLAQRLNAGALPVPIKLIAQQSVGPTLGADSLQKSLTAGLVGFLLVAIFMILLYRLPGLVSVIALALYAVLSAATFKLIPITLTLSGIAGFILSIGIAVDANVLIFERFKEEWREGKGLSQALEDAFRRAWPSIRDGHATVLISCAVLYWFSSSILRGFALTLAIGTLLSLFTAVVSARALLRGLVFTPLARLDWLLLKPKDAPKDPSR
jgi:preprotein translocase subunit SecD